MQKITCVVLLGATRTGKLAKWGFLIGAIEGRQSRERVLIYRSS